MTSSTEDKDWTEPLEEFLLATQTGLTVFTGLFPKKGQQPFDDMRQQVAYKIVHNMFQFVERHGAQGGKRAESEPRGDHDHSAECSPAREPGADVAKGQGHDAVPQR